MKTCLLCNTDAPNDAATCPNDGEASWSAVRNSAPAKVQPIDPVDSDDVTTKTRRGKR